MKRIFTLVFIALLAFLVVYLVQKPEVLENIWMWLVGLAGSIVAAGQRLVAFFKGNKEEGITTEKQEKDDFEGLTLRLKRYSDDGQTTLGLVFVGEHFFCYSLEDTFQLQKIAGETRIPAGTYSISLREEESPLTKKYRDKYPDWFTFHLQLQNVPGFENIYIHSGGTSEDTAGCLLVSDSFNISDKAKFLTNSRATFKKLYIFLSKELKNGKQVRIQIFDENWFQN